MSQQRWGHEGYRDGYQDRYQDSRRSLPCRGDRTSNYSPDAKETSSMGDDCDTAKCRVRRPPSGRHRSADLSVVSLTDRQKDDELQAVETATTTAKQRPQSKPKRPDVAIYVPRGRRQQEHANVHACPPEHAAEPKQEQPKKSAPRSARHTISVPRMRRSQNQESDRVHTDMPPEGATSQTPSKLTEEGDSLVDVVKHKTKRKKGHSKILDEKNDRETVKTDGKKKRKDDILQVVPPGDMEAKDVGDSDASVARSSECTDTSLPIESTVACCRKTMDKDQVESYDALQMVDIGQVQDSMIIYNTELTGHSTEKQDDKLERLSETDQLPGNQANDGSHDLAGSRIEVDIPTKKLVECTDTEQLEPDISEKSCLVNEDMCRNVSTKSSDQTVTSESEGKDGCEDCPPEEDMAMVVEQCTSSSTSCTEQSNNNTKEIGLEATCETDLDSQSCEVTVENKNVVDATSELTLSVCSERTLQDTPQTTGGLSATISDTGCSITCDCDTSENSDTGDVLGTHDELECCAGDVEAGDSKGQCSDEETGSLEGRLKCEPKDEMKESDADSQNELAGNKISEQASNEVCKSESEMSGRSVCDENKTKRKMDVQGDIESETGSDIQSENSFCEDENEGVVHSIESGKDEANKSESCKLKPSTNDNNDTGPAQSETVITSKTKKVKIEKVKAVSGDIGKSPDSVDHSRQGDGVAMDTEDEDDSWDKLFDDTGEALDPMLVEELTVAVGKVKVQKPQFDYFSFQPKELEMDDDEYNHLVEIYDFPSDLITRDLLVAFREYKDQGFDVKWVDDSHAIGIFSSSIAARGALGISSPFMKVRPISQATRATKLKAKHCTEFLQPYKERPETNASVARNLVAGALGLATRVPKEQRDAERKRLREARAKKKQAKQQVVDVWEGRVGGCAMDEV